MKKEELKNQDILERRDGSRLILINGYMLDLVGLMITAVSPRAYDKDLKNKQFKQLDIVRVLRYDKEKSFFAEIYKENNTDWSKIQKGTKVIVSNHENFVVNFEAEFIAFYKDKFVAYVLANDSIKICSYCKLMEE